MKKYIFLVFISLSSVGCGQVDRLVTHYTGDLTYKCAKNNVAYVQSDSGLAPYYNPDGTLVFCADLIK